MKDTKNMTDCVSEATRAAEMLERSESAIGTDDARWAAHCIRGLITATVGLRSGEVDCKFVTEDEREFAVADFYRRMRFCNKLFPDQNAKIQAQKTWGDIFEKLESTPVSRTTLESESESECRQYHLPRIAELERLNLEAQNRIVDLLIIIGDIEQCRNVEGDAVVILCDNPEADTIETQSAVELNGDCTGYEPQRFYGRSWIEALHKAADCSRRHYSEDD